jgi:hypothetical protein
MSHDDDRLDALLRGVPVPPELHAQLLQISSQKPQPHVTVSPLPRFGGEGRVRGWRVARLPFRAPLASAVAAAAVVAIVAAWVSWTQTGNQDTSIAATADHGTPPAADSSTSGLAAVRKQIEASEEQVRSLLAELEHVELSRRHARLSRLLTSAEADRDEASSLTRFLSAEAAVTWGLSPDSVRPDMEAIIAQFPSTAGADRARQFLAALSPPGETFQ